MFLRFLFVLRHLSSFCKYMPVKLANIVFTTYLCNFSVFLQCQIYLISQLKAVLDLFLEREKSSTSVANIFNIKDIHAFEVFLTVPSCHKVPLI